MPEERAVQNLLRTAHLDVVSCVHQREEVVQTMPDNQYGTLEVVGR